MPARPIWRALAAGALLATSCASLPMHRSGGWTTLVDGKSMDAWRGYQMKDMPKGWSLQDGAMTKAAPVEDLVSKATYGDFELEWEWKLGKGGNSGVFYRATEEYEKVYWSAPEYQLLDNVNNAGDAPLTQAGSIYALYPAAVGHVNKFDEWNTSRIVLKKGHVEHWLNGFKVAEGQMGSADWNAKVAGSKFKAWPHFGQAPRGMIAIQGDHQGPLAIRKMRIRALD